MSFVNQIEIMEFNIDWRTILVVISALAIIIGNMWHNIVVVSFIWWSILGVLLLQFD